MRATAALVAMEATAATTTTALLATVATTATPTTPTPTRWPMPTRTTPPAAGRVTKNNNMVPPPHPPGLHNETLGTLLLPLRLRPVVAPELGVEAVAQREAVPRATAPRGEEDLRGQALRRDDPAARQLEEEAVEAVAEE